MTALDHVLTWSQWLRARQLTLGLSVAVLFVVLLILTRGRRGTAQRHSHGSSRWATRREAKRAGLLRKHGYPLGKLGRTTLRVVNRHILLVGSTGSRKDRSHNFPFTAECPWSMVIVDVKNNEEYGVRTGENLLHCGRYRARVGPVYRLAPGDPMSNSWNPLDVVRVSTDHEFRDVMVLMQGLLDPKKKDTMTSDSGAFWERRGAIAGRGVLLYALHSQPPGKATLTQCHTLMNAPEATIAAMQAHAHPEVKAQGKRLTELMDTAERAFRAEWDTAQDALDLFSDPAIAAITQRSDFRLTDLQFGARPMTLYLGAETPEDLGYLYPLYRMLLQSTYRVLTTATGEQRRPLTMLLNEFAQLKWMDILERAPAHSRSARIWFIFVVQDLEQLFNTYGHETELWGNLGVKLFHAPSTHDKTGERLSRMLDHQTISVTSYTESERRSRTHHAAGRDLLTMSEVMGLGPEQVLVWETDLSHPLLLRKPKYWKG